MEPPWSLDAGVCLEKVELEASYPDKVEMEKWRERRNLPKE